MAFDNGTVVSSGSDPRALLVQTIDLCVSLKTLVLPLLLLFFANFHQHELGLQTSCLTAFKATPNSQHDSNSKKSTSKISEPRVLHTRNCEPLLSIFGRRAPSMLQTVSRMSRSRGALENFDRVPTLAGQVSDTNTGGKSIYTLLANS